MDNKTGWMVSVSRRNNLANTFLADTEWAASNRLTIAGDASNRRYERLTNHEQQTAILMDAPPEAGEDVRPFVRIASFLNSIGLSAPAIYHSDPKNGFLIIEDLGDHLFAKMMADDPIHQTNLYRAAIDTLVHLHDGPKLELPICNADWLTDMSSLVFEWYADRNAKEAIADFCAAFRPLAQTLDKVEKVVILRDFHAENLLWLPHRNNVSRVGLLDFQDALLGHAAYDLVSVLQDARRDVPVEIENQMIEHYLSKTHLDRKDFLSAYAILGTQRNLRILGIFARLCLRDGKPQYVDLIPRVWDYVMRNLTHADLSPIADIVRDTLPTPTPIFLEHLKSQCAPLPKL